MTLAKPLADLTERILERVAYIGECWEWTGTMASPNGYGRISIGGVAVGAHRASYEAFVGPIPAGLDVCHHCDNKKCVRPDHLFAGTRADNMADARAKGRTAKGSRQGAAKLAEADVPRIRALHADGVSQVELARRFGVTQGTIWPLLKGRTWRHV